MFRYFALDCSNTSSVFLYSLYIFATSPPIHATQRPPTPPANFSPPLSASPRVAARHNQRQYFIASLCALTEYFDLFFVSTTTTISTTTTPTSTTSYSRITAAPILDSLLTAYLVPKGSRGLGSWTARSQEHFSFLTPKQTKDLNATTTQRKDESAQPTQSAAKSSSRARCTQWSESAKCEPAAEREPAAAASPKGTSALSGFLSTLPSNTTIMRNQNNARRAAAAAASRPAPQTGEATSNTSEAASEPETTSESESAPARMGETKAQTEKRLKQEAKSIAKIKASRSFKRRRRLQHGVEEDEDDDARAVFLETVAPLPDQTANCAVCEKRFAVTPYTRASKEGGLICPKCAKDLDKEEGPAKRQKRNNTGRRRKVQSDLLDGVYPGIKNLVTLCVETLAKNADDAEELGDLPATMINKVAAILSKKRLVTSETLNIFLRAGSDSLTVYDGAKLSSNDYIRVFQYMPVLKHLRFRNGIQFNNVVMDHLLATTVNLETFSIHGSNLVTDDRWDRFLVEKGSHLKALQVYWTDNYFGNEQLALLEKTSPGLKKLKVSHNQKVTDEGLAHISKLPNLEHITLQIYRQTTSPPYVEILNSVGTNLRTFCLSAVHVIDDSVLNAIHDNCRSLNKFRITDNEALTDAGFVSLFTNWDNPPLTYIDLHKCRLMDARDPSINPENVGLCSLGFEALMHHSGKSLKYLDVASCRHISRDSFSRAFEPGKLYLELEKVNVSFCHGVDDSVVGCIFKTCPNLKILVVFGNFDVRDVRVPKGKILIGVPNAHGIQIEGTEDGVGRVV
ncbi:Uncharacterized protein BP5553_01350 [Venustampulla echinocandica]|uniref:DNA repair protein rhp7 treble clef domain-containing protein n=1 Tax=Venustampulla echinocandica TaxID=2656787 RepID=A0A370U0R7_9HELO|nr:Uncharacterized protein BP5553_01350 [Venustampulla echinocandica]RDL41371.1 Uncharacterized protein BP5553_01350 [Venustampulla echinocandica]